MPEILYNSDNKDSILKSFGPFTVMESDDSFKGLYFSSDKSNLEDEKYKNLDIKIEIKESLKK